MKKFLLLAALFGALLLSGADIAFTVDNPGRIKGKRTLRVGIPFPKGKFKDAGSFGVFMGKKQFPAVVTVLNRWPQDQSLRWAAAVFTGELDGSPQQKFTLKTGVKPLLPPRGELEEDLSFKPYFITASGVRYDAGKPEYTQIVEANSLRRMVKTEGFFRNSKNEPFCRYIIRQEFLAGNKESKLYFTFVITGDEKQSKFKDIGIEFPGNFQKGTLGGVKGDAMNKYLLQYAYDKYLVSSLKTPKKWQKKGDGTQAPGWAAADNFRIAVGDFAETFPNELEIRPDALVYHFWPAHGVKEPGFKVTDANRQYLRFCHEGEVLDFTAPREYWDVGSDYIKRYFREGKIESPMGVAKTAVLRIAPQGGAVAPEKELMALVDPQWLCASGVMRNIHHYDPVKFPAEEKLLYNWYAWERRQARNAPPGDFGKWNYGDSHSVWIVEKNRWDDFYRTWKGYHHSSGSYPWLLALRKGDFEICRWAIAVSQHLMDIDICNWSTRESEAFPKDPKLIWRRKIKGALNDYKGLTHWHAGSRNPDYNSQTEFALLYYYITGDIRGLDVAKMWGEAALKLYRRPSIGRGGTGMVSALTDLWLATGDKRYTDMIDKYITRLRAGQIKSKQPLSSRTGKGAMTGWANYQPGIQKYYDATHSPVAKAIIADWAACTVKGVSERTEPPSIDLSLYGWLLTKDITYLRYAAWFAESGLYEHALAEPVRHQFKSVSYFFLERLPFLMWAMNKYNKKVTPLAVGGGVCQFPYQLTSSYPKEGAFTVYLKSSGKPFELKCGALIGKSKTADLTLTDPDGKVLAKHTLVPGKNKENDAIITFTTLADTGLKIGVHKPGVLTLKIGPKVRRLALECPLPRVAAAECHYNNKMSGGTWAFRVKKAGTLTIDMVKTMDTSAHLQLESPDGKYAGSFNFRCPYDGKKKTAHFKVTPGIWQLRGIFGTGKYTLKLDGKKIPYVAPSKELWFDMDK